LLFSLQTLWQCHSFQFLDKPLDSTSLYSFKKAENKLLKLKKFDDKYRSAMAQCYLNLARVALKHNYYELYFQLIEEVVITYPDFKKKSRKVVYNFLQNICGFRHCERIMFYVLLIRKFVSSTIDFLHKLRKEGKLVVG